MSDAALDPKNQEAINAALSADWEKALDLNLELSKEYPTDAKTLNRLARAYLELGQISKARAIYQSVLKLDPYNNIAAKNLSRLANIKKKDLQPAPDVKNTNFNPQIFLEEPGKTKILHLADLAMPKVLANLRIGDQVRLEPQRDDVIIFSPDNKRLGKVDATWAKTLARALRLGSKFMALVKSLQIKSSSSDSSLSIFVKELERSPKLSESIFPSTSSPFTPYVREDALDILSEKNNASSEFEEVAEHEDTGIIKEGSDEDHQTSSLETLAKREREEDQGYEDD